MAKLTITSVQNYDKKKDGSPITDNKGRPKFRSVIKTVEKGETQLTGFGYKELEAGQVIEAEITTEQYNGNTQYKFDIKPDMGNVSRAAANTSNVEAELRNHTILLKQILTVLEGIQMSQSTHQIIESLKTPQKVSEKAPESSMEELEAEFGEIPVESLEVKGENDFGDDDFPTF